MIPYGRQFIDEEDIRVVTEVLRSEWLTTGPKVPEFEEALSRYVGSKHAVTVSSGTAALHAAMYAIGIGPGDEVIVSPITFAASANCIVYQGGTPVFSDVEPDTLLLDPEQIESKITPNTKAIIAIDYAGHPCDYDSLRKIADQNNLILLADACHALGAEYKGVKTGSLADLNIFSFHPVKHITTGEGGMVVTGETKFAEKMRRFRNHGIATDYKQREEQKTWFYEMVELGYNYRITDFQCALGLSQLKKLPSLLEKRRRIASHYDNAFASVSVIQPLSIKKHALHAYHLYVIKLNLKALGLSRKKLFQKMRNKGIGANVHYIPAHLHPYYRKNFGTYSNLCPIAEKVYEQIISIPIYPGMTDKDIKKVINVLIGK